MQKSDSKVTKDTDIVFDKWLPSWNTNIPVYTCMTVPYSRSGSRPRESSAETLWWQGAHPNVRTVQLVATYEPPTQLILSIPANTWTRRIRTSFFISVILHGLSLRANYTDRATAACWRSDCQLLWIEGDTWSAWRIPTAVFSVF
jgi:hypothetical protein